MNDKTPSAPATPSVTPKQVVKAAEHGRLLGFLKARLEPKAYLGLHLTVGLVLGAAGIWIFAAVVDALLDNATMVRLDLATDAFIHAHMTPSLLRLVSATTQLGGPIMMGVLGVVGAIVLLRARRRVVLVGWMAAFIGGTIIDEALKLAIHRSRPTYGAAFVQAGSYSFPSGHAMGSMIGYGMLLWVLFTYWHPKRAWKVVIYVFAGLLVLTIGLSRILLGVHYPSDVVGGWAAALAWLAVCITGINVARHLNMEFEHPEAAATLAA